MDEDKIEERSFLTGERKAQTEYGGAEIDDFDQPDTKKRSSFNNIWDMLKINKNDSKGKKSKIKNIK